MTRLPRRFRRNLISSYLNTATTAVITLVMTPVLVNGLGPEAFGIWAVAGTFALYLELLEFGFGKATSRYVAHANAVGDRDGLQSAVVTSFWLLGVPGLAALAVGGLIALAFPALFSVPADLEGPARVLILLILVDLAISIPGDTFGSALMGLQRFDLINVTLIVVSVAQAVAWAIVLGTGGGLVPLGIVTVAIGLVGQLWRYLMARRLIPDLRLSPRNVRRSLIRPFAGLSIWFAVIDISLIVLVRVDVVVVGLTVGVAAAGIYAVGQKLILAVEQLTMPATKMFFPHSSELEARGELVGLRESVVSGTRVALAVAGPLCLTVALLAAPILEAWVGSGFEDAATVVIFLACALVLTTLTRTGLLMLQGVGRPRIPAAIVGGEAAVNVTLSVVLAQAMGLQGVALGTLIAAALANVGLLMPHVGREFGLTVGSFLWPLIRAHLAPAVAATVVALGLRQLDLDTIPAVGAAIVATLGTYLGLLLLTGMNHQERRGLLSQLRRWRTQAVTPSV